MSLQVIDNNSKIQFNFPLQSTGSTPVSEVLIRPVDEKTQLKIKVSYIVKPVQS
jgi:hypothetical protein